MMSIGTFLVICGLGLRCEEMKHVHCLANNYTKFQSFSRSYSWILLILGKMSYTFNGDSGKDFPVN